LLTQIAGVAHKAQAVRALRHGNYRWFWFGSSGRAMGHGMQFLILGWLVLELTGSASQLGLVIFLYGIPNMTLVLFGGIFADRIDRRMMLITSQAAVTLIIFALAVLTVTDLISMWQVYTGALALGILQALNMPSRMAIVADLVEPSDLMNAVALNSAVMNSGRILGPALAGGIIELMDTGSAFYLNAACYLVGTLCLWPIKGLSRPKPAQRNGVSRDLLDGLRYLWTTPLAFTVIGMGFAFGFFGMPYVQVMPAFAREVLSASAGGAGLLLTAGGLGSLVGTIALASLGNAPHKNWILMGAFVTFSLGLSLFAWSTWFWVSWSFLLLVGAGGSIIISMITTILQLTVPGPLQGRVLSIWYVAAGLMFAGSLPLAFIGDALSWPAAITGGAVLCLLIGCWLGLLRPTLRRVAI
jgi:MFS family permease